MKRIAFLSAGIFLICFSSFAFAADIHGSRLLPESKVIALQDGLQVGVFTKEAPCPENMLLSCQGRCAVKLNNVLLMAEDQSMFSVSTTPDAHFLNVKQGKIFFGLSELPRKLVFLTPEGAVTAHQAFLNASNSTAGKELLEGYVEVSKTSSEIGLIGGGSLYLQAGDKENVLTPGNRMVVLDQSNIGDGGNLDGGGGNGNNGNGLFGTNINPRIAAMIGGGVGGGIGLYFWERHNDNSNGSPASPSKPK